MPLQIIILGEFALDLKTTEYNRYRESTILLYVCKTETTHVGVASTSHRATEVVLRVIRNRHIALRS